MMLTKKYPFDPSLKNHFFIAFGLAIWIFLFLYFTEPLDVDEFNDKEKLRYLPVYGLIGGVSYAIFLPLQSLIYKRSEKIWTLKLEILFLISFSFFTSSFARTYYLYVIMAGEQNPYSLSYFITDILLPAITIILPILIIGRFSLGKIKEKKAEAAKVEIKGEGTYEGLRLFFNDIICIQSSDNYIEVFYLNGKELKKTLIRNKLSAVAEDFPDLLRTHRSYLINPFHFLQWKSEKGKLFVELTTSIFAPISNTYKNEVKSILNSTTT